MPIFLEVGYDGLLALIIIIFLIIGVVAFLISLFGVYIYSTVTDKNYTTKELLLRALLITFILLVISGFICGLM